MLSTPKPTPYKTLSLFDTAYLQLGAAPVQDAVGAHAVLVLPNPPYKTQSLTKSPALPLIPLTCS